MSDDRIGVFESHAEFERQRSARKYFKIVTKAYAGARNTPALTAISYDEAIINRRLGPDLINYVVDVENATRKALGKNPALFDQWQCLIDGQDVPNAASIINKCGRLYQSRRLAPWDYFTVIKKGRADRRGTDLSLAVQ